MHIYVATHASVTCVPSHVAKSTANAMSIRTVPSSSIDNTVIIISIIVVTGYKRAYALPLSPSFLRTFALKYL